MFSVSGMFQDSGDIFDEISAIVTATLPEGKVVNATGSAEVD